VETCLWKYNFSIILLWVPEDDLTVDIAGSLLTLDLLETIHPYFCAKACVQNSAWMTSSFDVMSKNTETAQKKTNHSARTDQPVAIHYAFDWALQQRKLHTDLKYVSLYFVILHMKHVDVTHVYISCHVFPSTRRHVS